MALAGRLAPALALALALLGCVRDPALTGGPCPCLPGYQCCPVTRECLPIGASCADAGPDVEAPDAVERSDGSAPDTEPDVPPGYPRLLAWAPNNGPLAGGTTLRLELDQPPELAQIFLGSALCQGVAVDGLTLTCTTPEGAAASWQALRVVGRTGDRPFEIYKRHGFLFREALFTVRGGEIGVPSRAGGGTLVVRDLTGDDLLDVVRLDLVGNVPEFAVARAPAQFQVEDAPWLNPVRESPAVQLSDLDGDGRVDLLATYPRGAEGTDLAIWLLDTPGSRFGTRLGSRMERRRTEEMRAVVLDVDGDGWLDLFVARDDTAPTPRADRAWSTWRNEEGFLTGRPVTPHLDPPPRVADLRAADLDGDGDTDVVGCGDGVFVLRNVDGQLAPVDLPDLRLARGCASVEVLDFNLDGAFDLAAVSDTADAVGIWLFVGDGEGGFTTAPAAALPTSCPDETVGRGPTLPVGYGTVAVGDFDLDGDEDLVLPAPSVACAIWLQVLSNEATAGRQEWSRQVMDGLAHRRAPAALQVVDLDRDGDLDALFHPAGSDSPLMFLDNPLTDQAGGGPARPRWLRVAPIRLGRPAWGARVELQRLDAAGDPVGPLLLRTLTGSPVHGDGDGTVTFGVGPHEDDVLVHVVFSNGVRISERLSELDQEVVIQHRTAD